MTGWRVPLSDLDHDDAEIEAALRPLRAKWLSTGPEVEAFETEFAAMAGAPHAIAVSSGTAALHLAYLALGVGPGDDVVQPAMNFVSAANMTLAVGATPTFADIVALDEPTIDPDHVARIVSARTRAIVVMHHGGDAGRMEAILAVARANDVAVVEDACHAVGATYGPHGGAARDDAVGSLGTIACFSFFSNKNLATGEGGMVVTSDPELAARVRALRSHGMTTLTWDRHRGHAWSYDVATPGFNYRLDDLHAAIGRAQLAKLTAGNARRADLAARYRERLVAAGITPVGSAGVHGAHHLMVVLAPDAAGRDVAVTALREAGVQTSLHYPCISDFTAFAAYADAPVPTSREFATRAISLPMFPSLAPEHVDEIVEVLALALHR